MRLSMPIETHPSSVLRQVAPCPKCGALDGWFEKRVCKYNQIYEASGEVFDATNMERIRGGERKFCNSCDRDITEQVQKVDPAAE